MKYKIERIDRFGDIQINCNIDEMTNEGFSFCDLVKVKCNGIDNVMPYCRSITDVLPGEMVLCFESNYLSVCILNGDYASTYGVAEYDNNEYKLLNDDEIEIELLKKEGYKDNYQYFDFVRTNNPEDYDSDQTYANFREVISGILYRSSSPINPIYNRNNVADKLLDKYKIKTVFNLSDNHNKLESMLIKGSNYERLYSDGNVVCLDLNSDFQSRQFQMKLVNGLRILLNKQSPFLFHCIDGKDRTGFIIFILMSVCGYSKEEVIEEYLNTYEAYYHLKKIDSKYKYLETNACEYFLRCLGYKDNLKADSIRYLNEGGMSDEEINRLIERLKNNENR